MAPIAHESSSTERDRIRFALSITPYLESLVRALYRREEARAVQPSDPDESDITGPLAAITSLLNDAPEAFRLEPGPEITVNYSHFAPWPIPFGQIFEQLAASVGRLQTEFNGLRKPASFDRRHCTRELHICWQALSNFMSDIASCTVAELAQELKKDGISQQADKSTLAETGSDSPPASMSAAAVSPAADCNDQTSSSNASKKKVATKPRLTFVCMDVLVAMREHDVIDIAWPDADIAKIATGGKSVKPQLRRLKEHELVDARRNLGYWLTDKGVQKADEEISRRAKEAELAKRHRDTTSVAANETG